MPINWSEWTYFLAMSFVTTQRVVKSKSYCLDQPKIPQQHSPKKVEILFQLAVHLALGVVLTFSSLWVGRSLLLAIMLEFRVNVLNLVSKFSSLQCRSYLKTDRLSKLMPDYTSRAQEYLIDSTYLLADIGVVKPWNSWLLLCLYALLSTKTYAL